MKLWTMDHGINWNWFALVELHDDGTATVLREGRLHTFKDDQGASVIDLYHKAAGVNSYRMIEPPTDFDAWPRPPRTVIAVNVNGQDYPLREPVGRWSFHGLTREPEGVE